MVGEVITVTGISGSGSRTFCQRYTSEKIKIYHTSDMTSILAQDSQIPPIPKCNLHNLHPSILADRVSYAYNLIKDDLPNAKSSNNKVFIDTHAQFFWNQAWTNTGYPLNLPVDMFVTIIDKPSSIKDRQMQNEYGKTQTHDYRDLLFWQNLEVNITALWAKYTNKPHYVFSSKQNPDTIDSLLENYFLVYSSFPMTDSESDNNKKIVNFKTRLRSLRREIDGKETPILDPADVDIETDPALADVVRETISRQTVLRDLEWDIKKSTHVVAYYPDEKISLSKGVSDECTYAMQQAKFVYVICPRKKISPFMEIAHKVFQDEEQFFSFFKKHMQDSLENYKRSG